MIFSKIKGGQNYLYIFNMICKYRNCEKTITYGRSDKEYCSIKCRRNEKKYRQREKKKYEKINTGGIYK
jgi:hypothetical protein